MKIYFSILALVFSSAFEGLYATTVANPTFTFVANGSTQTVAVTVNDATTGCAIFYTLDGNYPTYTSPTITNGGGISISEYSTLTLQAFKAGSTPSAIVTTQFSPFSAVGSGGDHTLTLNSAGSLWDWGNNASGVFGTGNTTSSSSPVNSTFSGALPLLTLTTNTVPADSDGHGLPNYWQYANFGTLGNSPSALSSAGDGNTLLQEYQQNRSPTDYYQGAAPTITILSGNNQTGATSQFLGTALAVTVTNAGGTALTSAPVQFTVTQGTGLLGSSTSGTPSPTVTYSTTTDGSGHAQVYFQQPLAAGFASTISAAAGGSSVSFAESTTAPTAVPSAPTLAVAGGNTGQVVLNWTSPAGSQVNNYTIKQYINGAWTTVATVDASVLTYTISPGSSGGTSNSFQVSANNSMGSSTSTSTMATPTAGSPTDLTGTLDAQGNMNLSWTAPTGSGLSYSLDRETISTGVWQAGFATPSGTTYQDPASSYGSGGFRYRVSASADGKSYSAPSAPFPIPQFAVIDLGAQTSPRAINNLGSVVLNTGNSTGTEKDSFWKNGVTTPLPFPSYPFLQDTIITPYPGFGGLNNNDQVIEAQTSGLNYFKYTPPNYSNMLLAFYFMPCLWSYVPGAAGSAADFPPPNKELDTGEPLTPIGQTSGAVWAYSYGYVGLADNGNVLARYNGALPFTVQEPGPRGEREVDQTIVMTQGNNTYKTLDDVIYGGDNVLNSGKSLFLSAMDPKTGVAIGFEDTFIGTPDGQVQPPPVTTPVYLDSNQNIVPLDSGATPTGVNSLGEVLGKVGTTTKAWNLASSTTNLDLSTAPTGVWNAQHQILALNNRFWQSGTTFGLSDLLGDNSGWSSLSFYINAAAGQYPLINDSGALIGTAQQTLNPDGTPATPLYPANYYYPGSPAVYPSHGVMLLPTELAVDADRNGTIVLANENPSGQDANGNPVDATSQQKPFRFWLNNNEDDGGNVNGVPEYVGSTPYQAVPHPDYLNSSVDSTGDLQDWTRLWIYTNGLNQAIHDGNILVGLKWKTTISGSPAIKIMPASDGGNVSPAPLNSTGGLDYLKNETSAQAQKLLPLTSNYGFQGTTIAPSAALADFVFNPSVWNSLNNLSATNPVTHFLFEGASRGEGQLEIVFLSKDGSTLLGQGGSLWLDLRDIKEMYLRGLAGPQTSPPYNNNPPEDSFITSSIDSQGQGTNPGTFVPDPTEDTSNPTYIVYVHGYNQPYAGSTVFAERMFKRLWWHGFKGRFAAFRWPTFGNGTAPALSFTSNPLLWLPGGAIGTYNDSEYEAWNSGYALDRFINSLPSGYTIDVVTHSMGSITLGDMLRRGGQGAQRVNQCILLHAAASASCFSNSGYTFPTTNTLKSSPDNDTDSGTSALAYKGCLGSINTPIIVYSYRRDSVIGFDWASNNNAFKPQILSYAGVPGITPAYEGYFYTPSNATGQKLGFTIGPSEFHILPQNRYFVYPNDQAEAKAYADYSLTGTIGGISPAITKNGNLSFYDEYDNFSSLADNHSPEFTFDIQQTWSFYTTLLGNNGGFSIKGTR